MKCFKIPDGVSVGHVPDTCAGGSPNPSGCFLEEDTVVNNNLGTQCKRLKGKCYRTISFVFGEKVDGEFVVDGTCTIDCPASDSDEVDGLLDKLIKRKKKFEECICQFAIDNRDIDDVEDILPTEFKNYIDVCLKGIIPRKVEVDD